MKFVATKTVEQLDLQALHRVRELLVSQRTGVANQIRAFLLEREVAVRQGYAFCAPSCRSSSFRCSVAAHDPDHRRAGRRLAPAGRAHRRLVQ
jgi:hypothetical protein